MKGIYAAITTLVVTLLIAIPFFKLPVGIASGAVVEVVSSKVSFRLAISL